MFLTLRLFSSSEEKGLVELRPSNDLLDSMSEDLFPYQATFTGIKIRACHIFLGEYYATPSSGY